MIRKKITWLFLLAFTLFITQSCKKNNDAQPSVNDNTQGGKYYLNGTINGASWKAQMVVAGDTANLMIVAGVQIQNKDTSAIVIIFRDNTSVNQSTSFNPANKSSMGYEPNSTDPNNVYAINTAQGGTGTFTVTTLDKNAHTIKGIFSASLISEETGEKISITDGSFYMPYIAAQSPSGLPGGLKF